MGAVWKRRRQSSVAETDARPSIDYNLNSGEVAEWFKVLAWKASVRWYRTAGSNPALSANLLNKSLIFLLNIRASVLLPTIQPTEVVQ